MTAGSTARAEVADAIATEGETATVAEAGTATVAGVETAIVAEVGTVAEAGIAIVDAGRTAIGVTTAVDGLSVPSLRRLPRSKVPPRPRRSASCRRRASSWPA